MRQRNLYSPTQDTPYTLSRSRIELFIDCPRCFYLDVRAGITRPRSFPYNLNNAVDTLLKREFDLYRNTQEQHPLMETYDIPAVPYVHPDLTKWRTNSVGITTYHEPTHFIIAGAIDDIWQHHSGELHLVDYKATAKKEAVSIEAPWQKRYKRQLEIYQWLFLQNNFSVSATGYFVYANADLTAHCFENSLSFETTIIPYTGTTDWIDPLLSDIHTALVDDQPPPASSQCPYCTYVHNRTSSDTTTANISYE